MILGVVVGAGNDGGISESGGFVLDGIPLLANSNCTSCLSDGGSLLMDLASNAPLRVRIK